MHPIGKHGFSQYRTLAADWLPVTQVPAIVSREDFEQVQQRLSQNRQFARRNNRVNQYLLRGLISCGHCQAACTGRGRREDPRYHYYVCRNKSLARVSRPQQACPERMFPAAELDRLVWSDLCEALQRPDLIAAALERAQGGGWLPQELQARRDSLMKAQSALRLQAERLDDAYVQGIIPLGEFRRRRQGLEQKTQALALQSVKLTSQADQRAVLTQQVGAVQDFCTRMAPVLAQATFEQKRRLV
jgi:site-specific DNA recombinase